MLRFVQGRDDGAVGVGRDVTRFQEALNEMTYLVDDLKQVNNDTNAPTFGAEWSICKYGAPSCK